MKPFLIFLSGMVFFLWNRRRAFVDMNPRFSSLLKRHGLENPQDFLGLPAVIVGGHSDRNVARVNLQTKPRGKPATTAFLKREHRVPWRDRLANAWAGFGWCSKSYREALVLRAMRDQGVSCPELLAAGEDELGRAFLLVRELSGSMDLRSFLRGTQNADPLVRRRIAGELGEALARLHDAGFNHPDLYSKHVRVSPRRFRVSLLDCQRSHRLQQLTWAQRWRDLAALDATLADDLVFPRERMWCLRSYLRASLSTRPPRPFFRKALKAIRGRASRLLHHRHVREVRQPPLPPDCQNVIWIQGESLCVTRPFHDALKGRIPEKLLRGDHRPFPSALASILRFGREAGARVTSCQYSFRGIGSATLVQRRASRPWRWLWSKIRGRRWTSPELEQAGIVFRLERYGVRAVQVLAFGQTLRRPWQMESFLLLQDRSGKPSGEENLGQWLADHREERWTAEIKQRWHILRQAGIMLRRMHEAFCYLPICVDGSLVVEMIPSEGPILVLASAERIKKRRVPNAALSRENLISLTRILNSAKQSKTDRLRFFLSYLGQRRLTKTSKKLVKDLEE
jgi:hypothetical protein